MDVDWTWGLVWKLTYVVLISTCAMFGAFKILMGLGLGTDLAGLISMGVWISNFMLIDRVEK